MVKKGRFARMDGKEYELISYQHQYYLKSTNHNDVQIGFEETQANTKEFIKKISIDNLEDAYEVFPFAMLMGYRFSVEGVDKENSLVRLVTSNQFVQNKIAVKSYGKDEYMIELPYDDVVVEEDRIQILGFEK